MTPPLEAHISHLVQTIGFLLSRSDAKHTMPSTPGPSGWETGGSSLNSEAVERIRAADPNNIAFKEVELQLSDTWDAFLAWLSTEIGDANIDSIREDEETAEPNFFCSGKPGSLAYRVVVLAARRGIRFTHKLDLVHDWLHPLALSLEPTKTYLAWDTSLFPPNGERKKRILIQDPIASCRDCDYWVLFAKLR